MATLNKVDRARFIMDLIKDGEVANLANYANVEKLGVATSLKYAQAFWDAYPHPELFEPDGTTPRDPTMDELAIHYLNRLRTFHKEVLSTVRVPAAGEVARVIEAATVASEGTADLNDDESV